MIPKPEVSADTRVEEVFSYLRSLSDHEFNRLMEDLTEGNNMSIQQDDLILTELPPVRIPRHFPELENLPTESWEGSFMTRAKTSQFLGVSRKRKRWAVEVWANGIRHYIGLFRLERDAAKAYDEAARRLHGAGAKLNFPQPREAWCGPATRWRGYEERPSRFDPEAQPYRRRYRSRGHGPDQF